MWLEIHSKINSSFFMTAWTSKEKREERTNKICSVSELNVCHNQVCLTCHIMTWYCHPQSAHTHAYTHAYMWAHTISECLK